MPRPVRIATAPEGAPAAETRAKASGYLPTLDGWRAVAILLVILAHLRFRLFGPEGAFPNARLEEECAHFVVGVPIFFGISGLLICSRLLEERALRGSIDLAGFYVRRFFRILPPYLLLLGAILVLGARSGADIAWSDIQASLLFYRNYVPGENVASWYTGHFWSLAVEEHFYLLLPGILVLFRSARAVQVLAMLAAAVVAWRAVQHQTALVSDEFRFLTYRTDLRIDGLLLGALGACALTSAGLRARLRSRLTPRVVLLCLLALGLAPWMGIPQVELDAWVRHCTLETFTGCIVPVMLIGTILAPHSVLGRCLESAPLRWIGQLSYSLYLWQQLFLTPIRAPFTNVLVPALVPEWMLDWPWDLAAVLACACASYYLVERPLTRLGRRLATPATPGRAP
ncbi:MAG: acyltransferase [Planctomycetes bacterium]|nr:acyltransferase [Planctomycetota bacterium]